MISFFSIFHFIVLVTFLLFLVFGFVSSCCFIKLFEKIVQTACVLCQFLAFVICVALAFKCSEIATFVRFYNVLKFQIDARTKEAKKGFFSIFIVVVRVICNR